MKRGFSTVNGLLAFLLLSTFIAAAYFVSKAYTAQIGRAAAVQFAEEQMEKTTELEQVVGRLEAEWKVAAAASDNAVAQLEQFRGLIEDQDREIEYLLGNLQSLSNQLSAAVAVEDNLNHRLAQLDVEKRSAIDAAAGLRDKLSALEKEFEVLKNKEPAGAPSPVIVAGLTPDEVQAHLEELALIKEEKATPSLSPKPTEPLAVTGVSGTVREVNAKFGFVVLDLGAPNGVKPGDLFAVHRAKKQVGRLRVRKLHSGLSVCDIITEQTPEAILRGDQVQQLK
jgi:hypothetical protein